MLRFVLYKNDDEITTLTKPLKMSIDMDENVPADSLSAVFVSAEKPFEADKIKVYDDSGLIFNGVIDEVHRKTSRGVLYLSISARSLTAMLLDNESKPTSYSESSTSVIFLNHLKPCGITSFKGEERILRGRIRIPKGGSNWSAFYKFCVNAFGKTPRIERDGTAYFDGVQSDDEVLFSNENGVKYNSVTEKYRPYKQITKVYSKLAEYGGYSTYTTNPETDSDSVKRERYLDAVNQIYTATVADEIISNSNKESYLVTVESPERCIPTLGAAVKIDDKALGKLDNLYLSALHYSLSPSGESTVFTLKRRNL